jgi:hypothetical protein
MPKLTEMLFGKKDKVKQINTLTPEQRALMELINEGLTSGEGPFGDLFKSEFDQQGFQENISKPALKMFQEDILPQIQEKFIAGNQVLGSGMRRAQLKAAGDLQDRLAQLMYQAQQNHQNVQQSNRLAGVNSVLGTRGFENVYKQGTTGAIPGFLQGIAPGIGQGFGSTIAG